MKSPVVGNSQWFRERGTIFDRRTLKLELSSTCNASCLFCLMSRHPRKKHDFIRESDVRVFLDLNRRFLRDGDITIEPTFNGESLIHPSIFAILDLIVGAGCRLGDLDTNLGMDIDIPRLAAMPFRSVTVNLGGLTSNVHERVMGTPFELVLDNVKSLQNDPSRSFELLLKMNPTRHNIEQMAHASDFLAIHGLNIAFKHQLTGLPVPSDCNVDAIRRFLDSVYAPDRPELFRFTVVMEEGRPTIMPRNPRCQYLVPCMNCDGTMTICAHDQLRHLNLGNAFHEPLSRIFLSKPYLDALDRALGREFPFCEGCN